MNSIARTVFDATANTGNGRETERETPLSCPAGRNRAYIPRIIPVSLANLEYQSRMDMRLSALPAKNTDARCGWWRNHRGDANGWRVPGGRHCRHGRKAIPASWIVHLRFDEAYHNDAMLSTCRHPGMIACRSEWRLQWRHMDAVQWNVFMIRCWMQWAALPVSCSCADAHRKRDSDRSWIIISSQTKQIMGSVWYVRKCPRMNRAASAPNGMRNDEAKQRASRIEKPCHAWMYWRVSVVMTWPRGMRGMGWCWQHARDEICAATMIEVSFGGHAGQGLAAVALRGFMLGWFSHTVLHPRFHRFHSKLRLISKNAPPSLLYCFSFFFDPRVTLLDGAVSWGAERSTGNVVWFAHGYPWCGNL